MSFARAMQRGMRKAMRQHLRRTGEYVPCAAGQLVRALDGKKIKDDWWNGTCGTVKSSKTPKTEEEKKATRDARKKCREGKGKGWTCKDCPSKKGCKVGY